ncbi:hypothetical protein CAPTEDRAFT_215332 [Capitella teleta]|uniref:Uncharacterized protein n=1 Tax=Capitella teleta TaxID=283909 RepID=R7TFD9_CAPTE|nr:hypothetical protein CAPTEDRAFT_215332 [Capitella teleta]|eukprot:ELT89731.1 hypothetical protein CAPTEDRAFT_215332 [Capitella teleta]
MAAKDITVIIYNSRELSAIRFYYMKQLLDRCDVLQMNDTNDVDIITTHQFTLCRWSINMDRAFNICFNKTSLQKGIYKRWYTSQELEFLKANGVLSRASGHSQDENITRRSQMRLMSKLHNEEYE